MTGGDGGRVMARTVTIYGIKTCDTMKKARAWLDQHGVAYRFHDYRVDGIDRVVLEKWAGEVGWETLLNRGGTTFRALADADKQNLTAKKAIALMLAQPAMIKRPVLDLGRRRLVGFKPDLYAQALG
jgi:arsenate reductase (glutaredoxin)